VIVARRYLALMVVVTVAALGYLGVAHVRHVDARNQSRKLAAADAAQSALTLAVQKQAAAVLTTVQMPSSFKPANGTTVPACHAQPYQLCLSTTLSPRQAIAPAMTAMRAAGLTPGPVTCKAPPSGGPLQNALSGAWMPCRTTVATRSSVSLSLVAFPTVTPHKPSYRGPVSFDGTLISVEGSGPS
jgi:hypothetical protein